MAGSEMSRLFKDFETLYLCNIDAVEESHHDQIKVLNKLFILA